MTKHGLTVRERLALHYKKDSSGCWLWVGALRSYRYPSFMHNGKPIAAHRLMYLLYRGRIPRGHEIRHTCDMPHCVNPSHLITGTHAQNMKDASSRKRFPDRRGTVNNCAKLTEKQVLKIRRDKRGINTIGKKYGVDKTTIWNIRKRRTWTHLP